jgi:hypothetical protein
VSAPNSSPGEPDGDDENISNQERAAAALHAAFTRLQPQGSDVWNFLAAFTHLGDRYGPYQPGASGLSELLSDGGRPARREGRKGRLRPGGERNAPPGAKTELEEAMAQVVEAFRFLSSRVSTLEQRLASQDHPVDGAAWLVPARELGPWVEPVAGHIAATGPAGAVLHGDCGRGELLNALVQRGVTAVGAEPRGGVALQALERGCDVAICEVAESLASRPAGSLGGIVLSGVVDRVPLHALIPLLAHARRALDLSAPLVVLASDPSANWSPWTPEALDIVDGRPLHARTWEILLERAGFVDIVPLRPDGADDGRFALCASTPA